MKKCSACGHRMGVTHAQYTQCPANAAKNIHTNAKVPVLTVVAVEHVDGIKQSPVSSAFSLFNKHSDDTLTAEGAITIINISDSLPIEQQEDIYDNVYAQLDDKEKVEFVRNLKNRDDGLSEKFFVKIAQDPNTPRKVLKELRKWPREKYSHNYPEYVYLARTHGRFARVRKYLMTRDNREKIMDTAYVTGAGMATGGVIGFLAAGPVGAVVGIFGTPIAGGVGVVSGAAIAKKFSRR